MITTAIVYLAHVIGWTLIHFCWQGVVIALLLACVLSLFDSRWSRLRYAASCGALMLMVVVFLVTLQRVAVETGAHHQAIVWPGFAPAQDRDSDALYQVASHLGLLQEKLEQALPVVLTIWSSGFLFFLLRLQIGLLKAHRIAISATEALPQQQIALFAAVAQRLNVNRTVRLLRSASVSVPAVIGWLKPVVLVPAGCLTGMSALQMEAIFAHELTHIRRHDYLVIVLQSVVEALLFYHPAVWWVSRQIRKEREHCCDDMAAAYIGNPGTYARALLFLEEHRAASPAITLNANGGVLTMRIKRLFSHSEPSTLQPSAAIIAAVLLLTIAGICLGTARAQRLPLSPNRQGVLAAMQAGKPQLGIATIPVAASSALLAEIKPPAAPTLHLADMAAVNAAAADEKPMVVPAKVMAGNCTTRVDPVYPPEARAAEIQGPVVLHVIIGSTGDVKNLQVVSGPKELMSSAVKAVAQWKYKPYLLNGRPIDVDTTITVNYSLAR